MFNLSPSWPASSSFSSTLQTSAALGVTLTLSTATKRGFANCSMRPGVNRAATVASCVKPLIFYLHVRFMVLVLGESS